MRADRKKIAFISGTRADFGKLKPLIEQVEQESDYECHIFATGMHLISAFGYTYNEILKCGFNNVFPCYNQTADSNEEMDFVLANTVQGIGHYVRELKPDLLVVHGDRVEALAGAISGALNNILVAHIEGGELSGTVDELVRHAVSKLAHVHFVANAEAKQRLIQMGECDRSIYTIGSPDIDVMLSDKLPTIEEVKRHYTIEFDDYAILLLHSVTTELASIEKGTREIMEAITSSGRNYVVVYPNNDTGSKIIIREIKQLEGNSHFRILPSLRFEFFLALLKNSQFIIGNSSAGIREAPVYGVPTINIGTRQRNRSSHPSIVNVSEDRNEILAAINSCESSFHPSFHFGTGDSARRFTEVLRQSEFWDIARQKQFQDLYQK